MDLFLDQYNYKITLIVKSNHYDDDDFSGGTYKLEFEDSFYRIESGYMVVESKKEESIIGQIFDLKTIKSYKIWQ
jgi:hypothetical protein